MFFSLLIAFFVLTGMKNAMNTTLQISSINCIHLRGRASLTVESMCWDTFSRYEPTVHPPSNQLIESPAACWYLYSDCVFLL